MRSLRDNRGQGYGWCSGTVPVSTSKPTRHGAASTTVAAAGRHSGPGMIIVRRDPFTDGVMLSDTKAPALRPLQFTGRERTDFAAAVINGDYSGVLLDGRTRARCATTTTTRKTPPAQPSLIECRRSGLCSPGCPGPDSWRQLVHQMFRLSRLCSLL